ncbi:MAG: DUF2115 domain-containing protein [Methanobrevibacter sp.]|jgi:uncharacterized protein (UPF0305 family)|nr:DUF2115 domain-containing protein [Methanobrevibacter sp.]
MIFIELNKITSKEAILKKDMLKILQRIAKEISIHDLMIATAILRDEGKYVQKAYRENYLKVYVKYFIMRIKNVKEEDITAEGYNKIIDKKEFIEAIELLETQFNNKELYKNENNKFPIIYTIISLYTTFILDEPIHPVGTPFPGNLKVKLENGIYLCPVKDKQSDNPNAVCKFCIAKQEDL